MPLTKKGRKLERIFEKEYGKKRGKGIFYAYMKKHPGFTGFHLKIGKDIP